MKNNNLPFLDLYISVQDNRFRVKIYRKPLKPPILTHWTSDVPQNYKTAALRTYIKRALEIPMANTDRLSEVKNAIYLAKNTGMPREVTLATIKHAWQRHAVIPRVTSLKCKSPRQFSSIVSLPWKQGRFRDIASSLRKADITPIYKSAPTLQDKIRKLIVRPKPENQSSGVYKIQCGFCEQYYIGQTQRTLQKRFQEHKNDIQKRNPKSALAEHLKNSHRKIPNDRFRNALKISLLYKTQKKRLLNFVESVYIQKAINDKECINTEEGLVKHKIINVISKHNLKKKIEHRT
jgi:hypothetical protein